MAGDRIRSPAGYLTTVRVVVVRNYELSGFRLIRFEQGMVSDLMHKHEYRCAYYFALVFVRGLEQRYEYFPGKESFDFGLTNLGKVVDNHICVFDPKNTNELLEVTYFFSDGSATTISFTRET